MGKRLLQQHLIACLPYLDTVAMRIRPLEKKWRERDPLHRRSSIRDQSIRKAAERSVPALQLRPITRYLL